MTESKQKPDYGRRLLNHLIDKAAKEDPDKIVYSYPRTRNPADGMTNVTAKRFANAVNRTAHWLNSYLGKSGTFEPIGYIGLQDLTYHLLFFASVKLGYVMLFNSPRNSHAGHINIVNQTNCRIWALPSLRLPGVEKILADRPFKVLFVPEIHSLLDPDPVEDFPYTKSYEEARNDPMAILHTSGSTGLPKPLVLSQAWVNAMDSFQALPPIDGVSLATSEWQGPWRTYSVYPNFHSGGMVLNMTLPYFFGNTMVFGPADVPVNLGLVRSMFEHTQIDISLLMPSLLDEICLSEKMPEMLKRQRCTFTGGGAPAKDTGETILKHTHLYNGFGTTEFGCYPALINDKQDWQYFRFHPGAGFEFRERFNGLFELVQVKIPGSLVQGCFYAFPDLDELLTKDVWSPHPTKPDLWLYRGRIDDIFVLSSGENVNPTDAENMIATHPLVRSVLITGQGRFQPSLIIELWQPPPTDTSKLQELMDSIWAQVDEANAVSVAHGRIQPGLMVFSNPQKPFKRAGKGSVQRVATLEIYQDELDALYQNAEAQQVDKLPILDTTNAEMIRRSLRDIISAILGHSVADQDDIFAGGIDSLLVFRILRCISLATKTRTHITSKLTTEIIYSNPTTAQLSAALSAHFIGDDKSQQDQTKSNISDLRAMIKKYTKDLPPVLAHPSSTTRDEDYAIILTGSTGSLGAYLLDSLLKVSVVSRIYCLNRADDGRQKQKTISESRGLSTSWEKVEFWHADLSKPHLGLEEGQYRELVHHSTHIIHNQWQVDFNLSLSSFEPHVQGIRRLIDLSIESQHHTSIFFTSSIGVAAHWSSSSHEDSNKVPEGPIDSFSPRHGGIGYASSKLAAEHILAKAAEVSKVDTVICRVGQIAGAVSSEKGLWNPREWFPTIVSTSAFMKMVPNTTGIMNEISLIPVDDLAEAILEIAKISTKNDHEEPASSNTTASISSHGTSSAPSSPSSSSTSSPSKTLSCHPSPATFYNAMNPSTTSWTTSLLPTIKSFLDPSTQEVPFNAWLKALQLSAADPANLGKNPGIPLLDYYFTKMRSGAGDDDDDEGSGLEAAQKKTRLPLEFEMQGTLQMSPTLRKMPPAGEEWMSKWMRQWGYERGGALVAGNREKGFAGGDGGH